MNILLLGEYSGFYKDLKAGFVQLGHNVLHASGGDGWKNIERDVDWSLGFKGKSGYFATALYSPLWLSRLDISQFDIILVCNPYVFSPLVPSPLFRQIFRKFEGRFFLSIAGDDYRTYISTTSKLEYTWFPGVIEDRNGKNNFLRESRQRQNERVVAMAQGYLPAMYEYSLGYTELNKPIRTIPLPADVSQYTCSENKVKGKVVFHHGVSRPGFKGTKLIVEALNELKKRYPNDVELVIPENLPFAKYMETLRNANVVVDQANSYSYGMNAIIAMAMGKRVLSGAEPEAIQALGEDACPVVNIKPNVEDIIERLAKVLEQRESFVEMGIETKQYVERVHECSHVAQKYIQFCVENKTPPR